MALLFDDIDASHMLDDIEESIEEDFEAENKPENAYISTMFRCQSTEATHLCIMDADLKLSNENNYDIGGAYRKDKPEFWFYYTTTMCPKHVYLLNLFVCHRQSGTFALGVPNSSEMSHNKQSQYKETTLQNNMSWYYYKSTLKDEKYYIKTYAFTLQDLKNLRNSTLLIPLCIKIDQSIALNEQIERSIRFDFDIVTSISKQEKPDYVLISKSGKEYPVHKLILTAQSPVLGAKARDSKTNSINLDTDNEEIEILLEFIYTGTLKELKGFSMAELGQKLLEIYDKYQIKSLDTLIQLLLVRVIDVNNAVDMVKIAMNHNLMDLKQTVFKFIKNNPQVLKTKSWKELNNAEVVKALYQFSNT